MAMSLEELKFKLAYLPGGKDRDGKPILIVNVPANVSDDQNDSQLEKILDYLISIFNDETLNGICLIIDARRSCWKTTKCYIRRSINVVGKYVTRTIVIRSDGFWEKRVDNCTKSWKDGEIVPIYLPLARLNLYVDTAQIPYDLGGTKYYDHTEWIRTRIKVEEFEKKSSDLIAQLNDLKEKLCNFSGLNGVNEQEKVVNTFWETSKKLKLNCKHVLYSGRSLASNMIDTSQDFQDTINRIHDILDLIDLKQAEVEEGWNQMAANLNVAREIKILEEELAQVINSILGPGDAMLNSRCHVGFDVPSCENLRRDHEKIELECRETYGKYAKLLHQIEKIPEKNITEDLKSQKDFMDFICKSFASRLERRRNLLITSQRFFRLVSEYFDRTSDVFDKMIMSDRNSEASETKIKLLNLESSQKALDDLLRELVKEGEKLSDLLSIPVKDSLGRDVNADYSEDIVNIKDILDATNSRKNIFNDSVELQKLTLKQIILIHTYEQDANQAIKWLTDLFVVLVSYHTDVGGNADEISTQKDELQSFQETAKGTFDYGCQLLNGAKALRTSCKLNLDNNEELFSQLRLSWRQLRLVGQEQLTRLRVCTVFHRNVEEHCSELSNLINQVNQTLLGEKGQTKTLKEVLENREKLLIDVGRTVRLGKLLKTRLKEPIYFERMSTNSSDGSEQKNLTAIEVISEKLAEVTLLAEKLDAKLYEAGARTRIVKDDEKSEEKESPADQESYSPSLGLPKIEDKTDVESYIKPASTNFNDNIEREEINTTDEYTTATECSTTPADRSRSESFIECDETLLSLETNRANLSDQFQECKVVETELNQQETEINKDSSNDLIVDVNQNISKDNGNTTATSIIQTTDDKSGKFIKEVTEITTLRVSHDTKFGVASYKLTSNTHTQNTEHIDAKGILDTAQFNHNHDDERDSPKYLREELLLSEVNQNALENGYQTKHNKIIKEELIKSNGINEPLYLKTKTRNDDSGIEMSPVKNDTSIEDLDLFNKLKMVSNSPTKIVAEF